VELSWSAPITLDRIVLQEAIALGQRVEGWTAEADVNGNWTAIAEGTTIGHKRIIRVTPLMTRRLRVTITRAVASPTLSTLSVYGR
jgi:alpha-L-fucosidase